MSAWEASQRSSAPYSIESSKRISSPSAAPQTSCPSAASGASDLTALGGKPKKPPSVPPADVSGKTQSQTFRAASPLPDIRHLFRLSRPPFAHYRFKRTLRPTRRSLKVQAAAARSISGSTLAMNRSIVCSPMSTTFAPPPATTVTSVIPMTLSIKQRYWVAMSRSRIGEPSV